MSEERKSESRILTIRVGSEVYSDVTDFVLIIRDSQNVMTRGYSSSAWAEGAMRQTIRDFKYSEKNQKEDES